MTTTPDEPTDDSRVTPPGAESGQEQDRGGEEPEAESHEPTSPLLGTPSSGAGGPAVRGVAEDATSAGDQTDPDDEPGGPPTDFASEGYDDRQLDGTREAAAERGDFGPATTPPES
jgi:hypothetical protein